MNRAIIFTRKIMTILIIMVMLFTIVSACAEPHELINAAKLKEVEATDTFPVKIVQKKLMIGGSNDSLVITLQNNTTEVVKNIDFYIVAHDKDFYPVSLNPVTSIYTGGAVDPLSFVKSMTTEKTYGDPIEFEPGKSEDLYWDCNGEQIAGIRAIVISYEAADGNVHTNPVAEEWMKNVTGMNRYELD